MSYRKHLMTDDVPPSELYKTVKIDTDSDTISRQAAIEAADAIIARDKSGNNNVVNAMIAWREYIKHLQPAQPKMGKWILDGHHVRCNQCGMHMCNTDREGDPIPRFFCPNCGADMREVTT